MNSHAAGRFGLLSLLTLMMLVLPGRLRAEPPPAAADGFNTCVQSVEARLARQHSFPQGFLVPQDEAQLLHGGWIVEDLTPSGGGTLPDALLHHWRGTAFVRGASAAELERAMRSFADYPRFYAPQVLAASVVEQDGDRYRVWMRVRQRHGITVTLDTTYNVSFGRLDADHGFSLARSTEIREAGTSRDHGYLWRQNTYWSWEERDGGLLLQVESVSLTRSIPFGMGWLIGPYLESIPRESLAFTLRATCQALKTGLQADPAGRETVLEGRDQ